MSARGTDAEEPSRSRLHDSIGSQPSTVRRQSRPPASDRTPAGSGSRLELGTGSVHAIKKTPRTERRIMLKARKMRNGSAETIVIDPRASARTVMIYVVATSRPFPVGEGLAELTSFAVAICAARLAEPLSRHVVVGQPGCCDRSTEINIPRIGCRAWQKYHVNRYTRPPQLSRNIQRV